MRTFLITVLTLSLGSLLVLSAGVEDPVSAGNAPTSSSSDSAAQTDEGTVSGYDIELSGFSLLEVSPDGRRVAFFGALGNGCESFLGPQVLENAVEVQISLVISSPTPSPDFACTDDIRYFSGVVELDQPLDSRTLLSCGDICVPATVTDAGPTPLRRPLLVGTTIVASPSVAAGFLGIELSTGGVKWTPDPKRDDGFFAVGAASERLLLGDLTSDGLAVQVVDPDNGGTVATYPVQLRNQSPSMYGIVDDLLVSAEAERLVARQAATGELAWAVDVESPLSVVGDPRHVLTYSYQEPTTTLTRWAVGDGQKLWEATLDGQYSRIVDTSRFVENTVVVKTSSHVYSIDLDTGTIRWERPQQSFTSVLDVGTGLYVSDDGRSGPGAILDPDTGAVIEDIAEQPVTPVGISTEELVADDAIVSDLARLTRRNITEQSTLLEPADPVWTTETRAALSPALVTDEFAVVTTPMGVRAYDPVTGEQVWAYDLMLSASPRYGPPPGSRLEGASRIETAIAISQRAFPDGSDTVYLARADDPVDAVAGGTLTDGPILLVPSCGELPEVVRTELRRLNATEVIALGGDAAICDYVLVAATIAYGE